MGFQDLYSICTNGYGGVGWKVSLVFHLKSTFGLWDTLRAVETTGQEIRTGQTHCPVVSTVSFLSHRLHHLPCKLAQLRTRVIRGVNGGRLTWFWHSRLFEWAPSSWNMVVSSKRSCTPIRTWQLHRGLKLVPLHSIPAELLVKVRIVILQHSACAGSAMQGSNLAILRQWTTSNTHLRAQE